MIEVPCLIICAAVVWSISGDFFCAATPPCGIMAFLDRCFNRDEYSDVCCGACYGACCMNSLLVTPLFMLLFTLLLLLPLRIKDRFLLE